MQKTLHYKFVISSKKEVFKFFFIKHKCITVMFYICNACVLVYVCRWMKHLIQQLQLKLPVADGSRDAFSALLELK